MALDPVLHGGEKPMTEQEAIARRAATPEGMQEAVRWLQTRLLRVNINTFVTLTTWPNRFAVSFHGMAGATPRFEAQTPSAAVADAANWLAENTAENYAPWFEVAS